MMAYQIDKISPARKYGIIISGLTEKDVQAEATRNDLRSLWLEHGLIIFRGDVSPSFQVSLSKVFGNLEVHSVKEVLLDGMPELIKVDYDPECEALWDVGGELRGGWLPWHSDLIYVDRINHGGILRAVMLPSEGGETGFIDRIEAYDALPADLKERIENLQIVYKMRMDISKQRYASRKTIRLARTSKFIETVTAREDRDFPLVAHPAVYRQPETGRKVLNVSPMFAEYILGMNNAEGHELLERLVDFASDERLAIYHEWATDEMVLWDNWRMLHSANGVPSDDKRAMLRTSISGDYALGRKLTEAEIQAAG